MKRKIASAFLALAMIVSVTLIGTGKARAANVGDTFTEINSYGETIAYHVLSGTTVINGRTLPEVEVVANDYSGTVHIPGITNNASVVTAIGDGAFLNCADLTGVTLPSTLTSIGTDAFGYTSRLSSLVIPQSVTTIGEKAFESSAINSLAIPNGITAIADETFECSSLANITIADSVSSIGEESFAGCSHLTCVTIPSGVTTISRSAFDSCGGLTSVILSSGIRYIGSDAFQSCDSLRNITIPSSVGTIGSEAFYHCNKLDKIYFDGAQPSIGDSAFDTGDTSTAIYYKSGNTFDSSKFSGFTPAIGSTKSVTVASGIENGTATLSTANGILGETITCKTSPHDEYALTSLKFTYPGASIEEPYLEAMPDSDITVSATFSPVYTVTFDSNTDGIYGGQNTAPVSSASPGSAKTVSGGTVALPANPETLSMAFAGWNTAKDGSGTAFDASTKVYANTTVYAQWKFAIYTVANEGGSITPSGMSLVAPNGSLDIAIVPDMGHALVQLNLDGSYISTSDCYGFSLVTSNHILKATFIPLYTITATAETGGSISPSGATTIQSGCSQDYAITPDSGYVVSDVKLDGASVGAVTSYTVPNISRDHAITATFSKHFPINYTLNGGTNPLNSTTSYTCGKGPLTLPAPSKSGYNFGGWYTHSDCSGTALTVINDTFTGNYSTGGTISLYAKWIAASTSDGSADMPSPSNTYSAAVTGADTASLPVTVDTKARSASVDAGTQQGDAVKSGENVVISMPSIQGVTSYQLGVPVADLLMPDGKGLLTFNTDTGSIALPADMLSGVAGAGGNKAEITIGQGDKSSLPEAAKEAVGDRPLIRLAVTVDGKQIEWNNPNAPVKLSIPYTPTAEELKNPEAIVIWYIDGSGNAVSVPNGHYNSATGKVTVTTTHFSQYAVGFNKVGFSDVDDSAWYESYVDYLAARNIVGGTSAGQFSPDASITRAQFVMILARMSGDSLSGYTSSAFSDVSAGDWYFAAAQWANKNGIAAGSDGKFDPDAGITREQMAAMLYRCAKYVGVDVSNVEGMSVREFSDYESISSWALEPIQWAINNKIVSGTGDGSFAPQQSATRAQASKMTAVLMKSLVK